ncbi:MAG: threonine synthase, partial [Ignavibacteriales bacterium]|nr:threonine synthase [Ignavibacteriales bacterium]
FTPRASVQTFSNAMDVGNPSNLARLQAFYRNDLHRMRSEIQAVRVSDEETLGEIRTTFERTGYVLDPHTAVGVFAARRTQRAGQSSRPIVIAATAHPGKFPNIVKQAIGEEVTLPAALRDAMNRPKQSTVISAQYEAWKRVLLQAG